jgi:hypothetical protein
MRLLILLAFLAVPITAAAQQSPASTAEPSIPYFDVDRACATIVRPDLIRTCVELQQVAYDNLKRLWPTASVSARSEAIKRSTAALNSRAYYSTLKSYLEVALEMEEMQRPAPPSPQFRR